MDRDRLIATLRAHSDASAPEVAAAYLFGSVARGEGRPGSDVDVGVIMAKGVPRSFEEFPMDLEGDLERALGRPVDLIVMNGAPVDLIHRILRDGHPGG
jgi:predicted nucleotidyltransferase